jgi:hypothetical protein
MASTTATALVQQPATEAFAAALAAYNLAQRDRNALVATLMDSDLSCQLAHSVLCAARDDLLDTAADQAAPAIVPSTLDAESYNVTGVLLPSLTAQVFASLLHARPPRDAVAADEAPACKRVKAEAA